MGDVILDAFIDTLIVMPVLLIMNFLIELLEYRSGGFRVNKLLNSPAAPAIGAAVGVVPQCGFSVVATELYAKRRIALGSLLAVYLATSDEALPIMFSSLDGLSKLWKVLLIKVVFALVVGYAVLLVERLAKKHSRPAPPAADEHDHEHDHDHKHDHEEEELAHIHGCHHHELAAEEAPVEGGTRGQRAARVWRLYLKHPLLHTATVLFFIFAVNIVFGITVHYVGQARLTDFMRSTGYVQPLLAAAVGLIPNCAGSVVITELYVVGGLNPGGAVAGLCVSAGIGYAVLIRQNRPVKNTALIIAGMYVLSAALGMVVTLVEGAI